MDPDHVIAETRAWVDRAVIGLNLCPFAKAVQVKNQVRYVVSEAADTDALVNALIDELLLLSQAPPEQVETTVLVHPRLLQDFADFNAFLEVADATVGAMGLQGVIQVASFHPDFQFEGTEPGDITNATNRAPYPTLHLIREASIDRAVAAFPEAEAIYEVNMATLRALGPEGWAALRARCRADADATAPTDAPLSAPRPAARF